MASSPQRFEEISIPTSYLLFQVAASVKAKARETTATVSPRTTWTTALQTAQRSLELVDQQLVIFPKQTRERQQALKELALSTRSMPMDTPPRAFDGLPIRTNFPKHQIPPRASPAIRARLRELAKENMTLCDREPYPLQLQATTTERVLPIVPGTLRLRGMDSDLDDETAECSLDIDGMLWDTGAHCCAITEDILPYNFRRYLQNPEHEPYRHPNGIYVQVDGYIALSNGTFPFNCVFHVLPASSLSNFRSGVILGQSGFLNRITWISVPRIMLEMRGEVVSDDAWGEIHISDYVDVVGSHFTF
jgi:hypothetical protein